MRKTAQRVEYFVTCAMQTPTVLFHHTQQHLLHKVPENEHQLFFMRKVTQHVQYSTDFCMRYKIQRVIRFKVKFPFSFEISPSVFIDLNRKLIYRPT
jgi:hypothetical protein